MNSRMDESTTSPSAWVDALEEHDAELARVRLMWRRGGGRYRPMVRPDVDPNDLEEAPMSDWDANELPDAHPEWSGPNPLESVEQARARVRKMGAHFWRLALDWTRANGPICDVQLRGYTSDGGVLFEEGKRCNLAAGSRRSTSASEGLPVVERERVEHRREPTEHERERLEHERDFQARREARLMADVHQIHHTYGDLLGSLKRERDEAMGLTQETIRLVPDLFAEASKVIRDSLDHHRAQVRETVANATGKREYEFHAYSEQQETARHDRTIGFLIEAVQVGVGMLGPLASQIIETMRGRAGATGFMEFQNAQQALAYLHMTLTQLQLGHLFPNSVSDFMDILAECARCEDESEALRGLKGMEVIFKSPRWAQAAQPDQQIAARYVIGRISLLNIYRTARESAL